MTKRPPERLSALLEEFDLGEELPDPPVAIVDLVGDMTEEVPDLVARVAAHRELELTGDDLVPIQVGLRLDEDWLGQVDLAGGHRWPPGFGCGACNEHLFDACYRWAFCSLMASPGARAHYDRQRAKGKTHSQALRTLANRLVGILDGYVRRRRTYREEVAWEQALDVAA